MEFRKTIKKRFCFNLVYLALGIGMIVTACMTDFENQFLSSFGCCLAVIGIAQGRRNLHLLRNDKACKQREIAETDERNIMLVNKARSWAFSLYIIAAGSGVIVLSLLAKHEMAQLLSWSVCLLIALYWGSYLFLRKKY